MQLNRLGARGPPPTDEVDVPDGRVRLLKNFIPYERVQSLFHELQSTIPWRQDTIKMFGKVHDVPRLQQWFADEGLVYTWSGIRMVPEPWVPALEDIRNRLTDLTGERFNTVLANLYRNGADTVGWHADDEPKLGREPVIASISLGAERDFVLRHRHRKDLAPVKLALPSGSLLLMEGATQRHWEHSVPRRKRVATPRINLTYRLIHTSVVGDSGTERYQA